MIDSMEQEDFDIRNQQPVTSRERDFENALRPLNFEDFVGEVILGIVKFIFGIIISILSMVVLIGTYIWLLPL